MNSTLRFKLHKCNHYSKNSSTRIKSQFIKRKKTNYNKIFKFFIDSTMGNFSVYTSKKKNQAQKVVKK